MNAKWKILTLSLMAAMMLAACNTADKDGSDAADSPDAGETATGDGAAGTADEETDGSSEEDGGSADGQEADGSEERGPDRELTYEKDGSQKSGKAALTDSDAQDYSIYVLDGFELTSEEPGKDSLYYTEDDANFMRIEVFDEDGADYAKTVSGMEEMLAGQGSDPEDAAGKYGLAGDPSIDELVVKQAKTDEGLTTGAVFAASGKIVRLTVFEGPEGGLADAFLSMGATVGPKK